MQKYGQWYNSLFLTNPIQNSYPSSSSTSTLSSEQHHDTHTYLPALLSWNEEDNVLSATLPPLEFNTDGDEQNTSDFLLASSSNPFSFFYSGEHKEPAVCPPAPVSRGEQDLNVENPLFKSQFTWESPKIRDGSNLVNTFI